MGLIIGVAVGGTVVIVALVIVFVMLCRKYRYKSDETAKDKEIEMNEGVSPTTKSNIKSTSNPMMSSGFTPANAYRDTPEQGYYQNYNMNREQGDEDYYMEKAVNPYLPENQRNMYHQDRREPLNSGQGLTSPYPQL
jgi:hypothetical protein